MAVVVPVYNRTELLARALRSVLAEPMPDLEVIVVDDASTIPIEPVVSGLRDQRVRYVRRSTNGGPAAACNTGLDEVVAPQVQILHSDDEQKPTAVARASGLLASAAPHVCAVETAWSRGGELVTPRVFAAGYRAFRRRDVLFHISAFVFRTDVVRRYRFDEELWIGEDWDLVLRLSRDFRLLSLGAVGVAVDTAEPSRLTHRWSARPDQVEYLYRKHDIDRTDRATRGIWHFQLSRLYARAGDIPSARRHLVRSVAASPRKAWRLALLGGMTGSERHWRRYSSALARVTGRANGLL